MKEALNTITNGGESVDIKRMNEELDKTDPEIEKIEELLRLSQKELSLIEADADRLLGETQTAAGEVAEERLTELKIDNFATEVAERKVR